MFSSHEGEPGTWPAHLTGRKCSEAAVLDLYYTGDQFRGRQLFCGSGLGGMVLG